MISKNVLQYQILEKLGKGGMGVVYKAFDTKLKRTVALKFLPENLAINEKDQIRFLREAQAASAINHPNVCTIYDLKDFEGEQFIVMEYVKGRTLREIVGTEYISKEIKPVKKASDSPLPLQIEVVVDFAVQIAKALRAAHEKGIVHRDIKSENIMVTPERQIKVMDFGLAIVKGTSRLTQSASTVGTIAYMSPEQIEGKKIDHRSDIFSFGVVFYEMLTGRLPFMGDNQAAIVHAILHNEPKALAEDNHIPVQIKNCLFRALEKDVEKRYQTIGEMLYDLRRLQQDKSIRLSHINVIKREKSEKFHRSFKKMWLPITTFLFLIFLIFIFFLIQNKESHVPFQIIPLTSGGGKAEGAKFSPDGSQIVYYCQKNDQNNSDIYIQQIGTNQVLQLTSTPLSETWPAWSPDGKYIAFCRSSSDSEEQGIYLVSSLGGTETKLSSKNSMQLNWSPDGRLLAFSNFETGALFLLDVESRQEKQITFPKVFNLGFWIDQSASFSPDGKHIAFARFESYATCCIYIIPTRGGEPKKITFDNESIYGLAWSSNRNRIIYSSNRAVGRKLWSIKPSGKDLKPVISSGHESYHPAVSKDGKHLLYSEFFGGKHDIGRITIPNQNTVFPQEIIAFQGYDCWPDISPDGNYLTFVCERSGYSEVWKCDINGENLQQITTLENYSGRPRWSPDGQHICFDSRPDGNSDIFVVSANGGLPQQLTKDSLDQVLPNWSRDGEWIYYSVSNKGDNQIFRIPSHGGTPQQITTNGGLMAFDGMDGESILVQKLDNPVIYRVSLDGSQESLMFEYGNDYRRWVPVQNGIYYFSYNEDEHVWIINFFSFLTRDVKKIASIENLYHVSAPVISPDGLSVYFHYVKEHMQADIYLVENFE